MFQKADIPSLAVPVVLLAVVLTGFLGCSSEEGPGYPLAPVTGTVTLDGKPLSGADIVFEPQGDGTLSYAKTSETGAYEILFKPDIKGAPLGMHTVRISKIGEPDTKFDTINMLPAKYHDDSTLTVEVKSGPNTFDFDLTSNPKN